MCITPARCFNPECIDCNSPAAMLQDSILQAVADGSITKDEADAELFAAGIVDGISLSTIVVGD